MSLQLEPSKSPTRLSRAGAGTRHGPGSPCSVRSSVSSRSSVRFATGPRKKTPARRTEELFELILEHLSTEWMSIKSLNLGVKSGTGMVDELVLRRVSTWITELHTLSIAHDTAAAKLGQLARHLSYAQMQQLQALCDITGHEHLTDYMRLCVYNTSDPFAKTAVDGPSLRGSRGLSQHARGAQGATASTAADNGRLGPYTGPRPGRDEFIRFAGYLPPEHPLVQGAYEMYLSRLPPEPQAQGGDNGDVERRAREESARQRNLRTAASIARRLAEESGKNVRDKEVPLWLDVEARWRSTNHTIIRDELLSSPIIVGDPMPLYASQPEFKRQWQEKRDMESAAAAAAAQAAAAQAARPSTRMHITRQSSGLGALTMRSSMHSVPPTPGTPGSGNRQSAAGTGHRQSTADGSGQGLPATHHAPHSPGGASSEAGGVEGTGTLPPLEPGAMSRAGASRFKPQT